jgi:hypothetical protein
MTSLRYVSRDLGLGSKESDLCLGLDLEARGRGHGFKLRCLGLSLGLAIRGLGPGIVCSGPVNKPCATVYATVCDRHTCVEGVDVMFPTFMFRVELTVDYTGSLDYVADFARA